MSTLREVGQGGAVGLFGQTAWCTSSVGALTTPSFGTERVYYRHIKSAEKVLGSLEAAVALEPFLATCIAPTIYTLHKAGIKACLRKRPQIEFPNGSATGPTLCTLRSA